MKKVNIRRQTGFTMIEVLIVMMLIAVTLVLVAPNFMSNIRIAQFSSASDQLVSDLNFARQAAVDRNTNVTVVFNPNAANGPVYTISINGSVIRNRSFERATYGVLALQSNAGNTLIFNNYGLPLDAGNNTPVSADVTLIAPDGQQRMIQISTVTGIIQ